MLLPPHSFDDFWETPFTSTVLTSTCFHYIWRESGMSPLTTRPKVELSSVKPRQKGPDGLRKKGKPRIKEKNNRAQPGSPGVVWATRESGVGTDGPREGGPPRAGEVGGGEARGVGRRRAGSGEKPQSLLTVGGRPERPVTQPRLSRTGDR